MAVPQLPQLWAWVEGELERGHTQSTADRSHTGSWEVALLPAHPGPRKAPKRAVNALIPVPGVLLLYQIPGYVPKLTLSHSWPLPLEEKTKKWKVDQFISGSQALLTEYPMWFQQTVIWLLWVCQRSQKPKQCQNLESQLSLKVSWSSQYSNWRG